MSHILLVEESKVLAEMYKAVLSITGFKVIHFLSFKELYKKLDGEGFTAIFLNDTVKTATKNFISRVRKNTNHQIPIFVIQHNKTSNQNPYLTYSNVTCLPGFPNSGKMLLETAKNLSPRSQFKGLLHDDKFN